MAVLSLRAPRGVTRGGAHAPIVRWWLWGPSPPGPTRRELRQPPPRRHLYTGHFGPPMTRDTHCVRVAPPADTSTKGAESVLTHLPPPRTHNIRNRIVRDGGDGGMGTVWQRGPPLPCGGSTNGEPLRSSAHADTHAVIHTPSHSRAYVYRRPRTTRNTRSRSRPRRGGESARPVWSPAGTPLTTFTLLSDKRTYRTGAI